MLVVVGCGAHCLQPTRVSERGHRGILMMERFLILTGGRTIVDTDSSRMYLFQTIRPVLVGGLQPLVLK